MTRRLLRDVLAPCAATLGLGPDAVELAISRARLVSVTRGGAIEPQPLEAVGLVIAGAVRIEWRASRARTVTVGFADAGRVFHLGDPFATSPAAPALHAEAHTDAEVAWLPAEVVAQMLGTLDTERQLALLERVWRGLSRQLATLCALRTQPLAVRVRAQLEALARQLGTPEGDGARLGIPLTHADVAQLVAGSRPNVTRAIGMLEREGRLCTGGGRWLVRTRRPVPPADPAEGRRASASRAHRADAASGDVDEPVERLAALAAS